MSSAVPPPPLPATVSRRAQAHAITASFLGWTMDAFDFFILVFMMDRVAADLHVHKAAIVFTLFGTLLLRPVGALIFGMLADRYGRRRPLIANVVFFSLVELCCGFAPNYAVFLALRCLYGIGMGGEWGVGASLAMEIAPKGRRGVLSGILQSGYSVGYLLAAVAAWAILPHFPLHLGWRVMFWSGGLPALLAFYIRTRVPESEAWKQHRAPSVAALMRTLTGHGKSFAYLVALMTLMMFLSHGTQDLYPDFLHEVHRFSQGTVSSIAILYNVGAVLGAVIFGHFSEAGRRRSMIAALGLSLVMIPLWAFGRGAGWLALGAFLMQVGVQGAWGVIPAHLTELVPDSARGLMPGLAYQLGILFASPVNSIEYHLRDHLGYPSALALFEVAVILSLAAALLLGGEQRGRSFLRDPGAQGPVP